MVTGVLILLPCFCLLVWLLWPSDEEQIRSQFDELCEVASKTEDASTLSDAMVVKDFRELFAPKVVISIRSKARIAGEHTDHELSQKYGRLRFASSRMGLRYDNLKFLAIEEQVARVSVQFFASWTGKSGKTIREDAHTEVELKKIDGDWKISQIHYLNK